MSKAYYNYRLTYNQEKRRKRLERRKIRDAANPFELPDNEFLSTFHISKDMAHYLCKALQADLAPQANNGLPVHYKVLVSIKCLTEGSYQSNSGQHYLLNIAQTTVSKFLTQFAQAVVLRLVPKWISFPGTEEERKQVSAAYQEKFGVPNVLGAISCTHVEIHPLAPPRGQLYINREGKHTINVQVISDSDCKIINVNAKYPGKELDQFIFDHSVVRAELNRLHKQHNEEYFLLGHSSYRLEPWLLTPTPITETYDTPEDRYSNWHCCARSVVDRTINYLKGTLKCISNGMLHYSPEKSSNIILGCCAIYNIMKHYNIAMESLEQPEGEFTQNNYYVSPQHLEEAVQQRSKIIDTFFNNDHELLLSLSGDNKIKCSPNKYQ